ncbi:MAG: hypothetical protein AAF310_04235 [Myxococcota bacterium]
MPFAGVEVSSSTVFKHRYISWDDKEITEDFVGGELICRFYEDQIKAGSEKVSKSGEIICILIED